MKVQLLSSVRNRCQRRYPPFIPRNGYSPHTRIGAWKCDFFHHPEQAAFFKIVVASTVFSGRLF
ncbi:hypothetical protein, partial [Pseudomonas aeruginosa]|uniref:hypothetical protein n=1 Tax=Pseudomonas aeruginosa TaxID=287 RepID=UPI003BF48F96